MPRMMMWMAAGGSTLAGATLTYVMTKSRLSPVGSAVQDNWKKARRLAGKSASWPFSFVSKGDVDSWKSADSTSAGGEPFHSAFDEYRHSKLKALADDEREFQDFLDRLRHAKDRSEFDLFMSDRKLGLDEPNSLK